MLTKTEINKIDSHQMYQIYDSWLDLAKQIFENNIAELRWILDEYGYDEIPSAVLDNYDGLAEHSLLSYPHRSNPEKTRV